MKKKSRDKTGESGNQMADSPHRRNARVDIDMHN